MESKRDNGCVDNGSQIRRSLVAMLLGVFAFVMCGLLAAFVSVGAASVPQVTGRPGIGTQTKALADTRFSDRLLGIDVQLPLSHWSAIPAQPEENGRLFVLNNFKSKYLRGGFIPPGGAEITLVADKSPDAAKPIDQTIDEYLDGDKPVRRITTRVNGCNAKRVDVVGDFVTGVTYRRDAIFMVLKHGETSVLYKFFLMYNADERAAVDSFDAAFNEIVASVQLVKPAVGCGS